MKAYKVFNNDWTCRGFQFKVGETFEENGNPELCSRGFHACKNIVDCFSYYSFNPENKVAEVELLGVIVGEDKDKQATNKIRIVKELTWQEVLVLANTGKGNTGYRNSGHNNSGYNNSGDNNSGHNNSGDNNSGHNNSGDRNSGDNNSGHNNSGHNNSGYNNSGHNNSGDNNSGHNNSGYRNSGYNNSGDRNSGDYNVGDFNSITPSEISIFNKPCDRELWQNTSKPDFIYNVELNRWIWFAEMTDKEKIQYPKAYVCDGYLKTYQYKEAWKIAFENRSEGDLELLKALPNFDAVVFEEITGININNMNN